MDPAKLYPAVGARIRACREKAGLSQDALADAANLVRTSITNIESGRQRVQLHTLYAIAEALERRVSDLLPTFDAGDDGLTALDAAGDQLRASEREWIAKTIQDER